MYKKGLRIISFLMIFISAINIQAETIELNYDGKRHYYDLPPITLCVNNQIIDTQVMPPIQLEEVTLVPVREVFEPLGAFIEWKEAEKKVYIDYQNTLLILEVDNTQTWLNGEWKELNVPAKIINGKIMVPLRFISEQIGFDVKWVGETREIYITDINDKEIEESEENIEEGPLESGESVEQEPITNVTDLNELMMSYDNMESMITIYLPNTFEVEKIEIEQDYINKKIRLDLGEDYSHYFQFGMVNVSDEKIRSIKVETEETTQIILEMNRWHESEIIEVGDCIQVKLARPKEKYDKILLLDAGHGGSAPGSIANGLIEKDVNLRQTLAVKNFIESNTDIKVYLTREEDISLSVEARPEIANDIEADVFVSIHNNSAESLEASGTEVLYYPDEIDTRSREIASILQEKLIIYTGLKDRGIKPGADLWVLKMSQMPAALIEGGFLSNKSDASYLASGDFNTKYAYAVYEAVVEIFNTMSFR